MQQHLTKFLAVAGAFPAILFCQSLSERKYFDVASIKSVDTPVSVYDETPGQIRYVCSLVSLVQRAYGVGIHDLQKGALPGPELFEIRATLPAGASKSDIPFMLRSLLEDRFKLSVHWENRPTQLYRLTIDPSGLKLQPHRETAGEPATDDKPFRASSPQTGMVKFMGSATLDQFAAFLDGVMDYPVVNEASHEGTFDIALDAKVPPRDLHLPALSTLPAFQGRTPADPDHPQDHQVGGMTLYANAPEISIAVRKMGLRLEKSRGDIRVLVVDSVNKKPTSN